jgi:hypothetical protein
MTHAVSIFRNLTTRVRFGRLVLAAVIAVAATTALPACTGNGTLRIGPFGIMIPAGEGSLLRDLFLKKVVVSNKEEVCDLPSEADLAAMVSNVGNIDLSDIIAISDLDLVQTVVTATSGDFGFLTEMTVRWIPAPINGQEQDPVVLGTASDPNGFGSVIVLVPSASVDLIDLIRLNDMNTSSDCPEIEIEVDANGVPTGDVEYTVDLDIDAYVEIG